MQGPRTTRDSDVKRVANPSEIKNASVHLCPRACPRTCPMTPSRHYALKSEGDLSEFQREDCLLDYFRVTPNYGLSYYRPPRTWVDRAGHYSCFHTHYELSYSSPPTTIFVKIAGGLETFYHGETLILTVRNLLIQTLSKRFLQKLP